MLIILFLIFITLTILCASWSEKTYKHEFAADFLACACGAITVLVLITSAFNFESIPQSKIVDNKIAILQEENEQIEKDIDELVQSYIKYEGETFKPIKAENSMQLIQLYPELKSNKLVQDQMELHIKNNNKIKSYKLKKQDYEAAKWWLYFGGKTN